MVRLRYSFWDDSHFPGFSQSFYDLSRRSEAKYQECLLHGENSTFDGDVLNTFLGDLESFYATLFPLNIITKHNFSSILKQMKSVHCIHLLPVGERKYYGLTYRNSIFMNPDIKAKYHLSENELKQMCISHELSHILNRCWEDDQKLFCKKLSKDPTVQGILKNMGLENAYYLDYGFSFLDELIAQETAERVTYHLYQKNRPKKEYRCDKAIFQQEPYVTNYTFYGELQSIGTAFARSLKFLNISSQDSDEDALLKLLQSSFSSDFIRNIQKEVMSQPDEFDSFIVLLACMGRIREATYHVLGLSADSKTLNVNPYVSIFYQILEKKLAFCDKEEHSFVKKK